MARQQKGWVGVVVLKGEEQIFQAQGPVPGHLPQTAPSAEWCAAEVAATIWSSHLPNPEEIASRSWMPVGGTQGSSSCEVARTEVAFVVSSRCLAGQCAWTR